MDLCLPQFDIYQSTVGSNCFESHTNSCCPDLFQKKCLSDVQSEIHLVRRNIVSTGFKNIYIQAWYGFFTHVFLILNYWNFDIGMFVLRLSISVQVIKKLFGIRLPVKAGMGNWGTEWGESGWERGESRWECGESEWECGESGWFFGRIFVFTASAKITEREGSISPSSFSGQLPDY